MNTPETCPHCNAPARDGYNTCGASECQELAYRSAHPTPTFPTRSITEHARQRARLPKDFQPSCQRHDSLAEQYAVWILLTYLTECCGCKFTTLYDGEEEHKITNVVEAMELIFNLDECAVYFKVNQRSPKPSRSAHVYLVLGNAPYEVLSDYSISLDPALEAYTNEIENLLKYPYLA